MKTKVELDIEDIKRIIAEKFNVTNKNVHIIDCGCEGHDGIYPGRGYYCDIEVEVTDIKIKQG